MCSKGGVWFACGKRQGDDEEEGAWEWERFVFGKHFFNFLINNKNSWVVCAHLLGCVQSRVPDCPTVSGDGGNTRHRVTPEPGPHSCSVQVRCGTHRWSAASMLLRSRQHDDEEAGQKKSEKIGTKQKKETMLITDLKINTSKGVK